MIRMFVCSALLGAAIWAQAPSLNGKFVLANEGPSSSSLALLTFDPTGSVSGMEYVQSPGITQLIVVTGNYAIAADGSGTMTLHTQISTEDGPAMAVSAVYEFLRAKAGGFVAIRRDSASATLAEVTPASPASSFSGEFTLAEEGSSASGQSITQIGVLTLSGDGSLNGQLVNKQAGVNQARAISGSYALDSSGFGSLKFSAAVATDEDGGTILQSSPFVFLATSKGTLIALHTDNSLRGLVRLEPVQ